MSIGVGALPGALVYIWDSRMKFVRVIVRRARISKLRIHDRVDPRLAGGLECHGLKRFLRARVALL